MCVRECVASCGTISLGRQRTWLAVRVSREGAARIRFRGHESIDCSALNLADFWPPIGLRGVTGAKRHAESRQGGPRQGAGTSHTTKGPADDDNSHTAEGPRGALPCTRAVTPVRR